MLAHRFKELLALANQAGKGFASEHLLDLPEYEFPSEDEQFLLGQSLMKRLATALVVMWLIT